MIEIKSVKYQYKNSPFISFPDFKMEKGEQALILGESGCGKTTLLHLLSGMLKPQQGNIVVNNSTIEKLSATDLDKFRGKNIGVIFQVPHFVESLNVIENLLLAQSLSGKGKDKNKIVELLTELGLKNKEKSKVKNLSQGEKQRVSIIRALIISPALILADEPTSALDDTNCEIVVRMLKEQAEKFGATLLLVTHDNRLKDHFQKQIQLQAINPKVVA